MAMGNRLQLELLSLSLFHSLYVCLPGTLHGLQQIQEASQAVRLSELREQGEGGTAAEPEPEPDTVTVSLTAQRSKSKSNRQAVWGEGQRTRNTLEKKNNK